jgi:glutamine synthetase
MTATATGASARDVLGALRQRKVRFLLLQFTDLLGVNKAVEVPATHFERALAAETSFDGSALEGFARVEEADALLAPDLDTFQVLPPATGTNGEGAVARLICDIRYPDGRPFEGCPRTALKRHITAAEELGFTAQFGCEVEFFLFERGPEGQATTRSLDTAGYFDLVPVDRGEQARRAVVAALEEMQLVAEASHHEVAPGQHEIDLRPTDPLTTADNIATLRYVVRSVALQHGLVATFMPKPRHGVNGSGMHTHQTLLAHGHNAFHDPRGALQLSDTGRWYVGGLLRHALGYCAVTNPLVNSYKRFVTGFEAPVNVSWSTENVSPLIRVPAQRDDATRCENRLPDPSANPYLALAVQLAAGLDGIRSRIDPGEPVNKNISRMSYRERRRYRIDELPRDLHEALDYLEKDDVIRAALGDHIYERFVEAKREEYQEYVGRVSHWEIERYLGQY